MPTHLSRSRAFVADATHELHTPLTALQANLELARDEKNASAHTRYLVRVQEQAQRLEALVKSLLDLSRIEAADADAVHAGAGRNACHAGRPGRFPAFRGA